MWRQSTSDPSKSSASVISASCRIAFDLFEKLSWLLEGGESVWSDFSLGTLNLAGSTSGAGVQRWVGRSPGHAHQRAVRSRHRGGPSKRPLAWSWEDVSPDGLLVLTFGLKSQNWPKVDRLSTFCFIEAREMSFLNLPPPSSGGAEEDGDTGIPNIHIVPIAGGAGAEVPGDSSPGGLRVGSFPPQNPVSLSRTLALSALPAQGYSPGTRVGAMAAPSLRGALIMQAGRNWRKGDKDVLSINFANN